MVSTFELVYGIGYEMCFFVGHEWPDGEADFLASPCRGLRKVLGSALSAPRSESRLLCKGEGVVDECTHAAVFQVLLQSFALLAAYGEDVVDVVFAERCGGETNGWVAYGLAIDGGDVASPGVVFVQSQKLELERGCLHLVHSAVYAEHFVVVFVCGAIVG